MNTFTKILFFLSLLIITGSCSKDKENDNGSNSKQLITTKKASVLSHGAILVDVILESSPSAVSERGICFSTSEKPTINDRFVRDRKSGLGAYSIKAQLLTPETTYYLRAYAINEKGVFYGNEVEATTEKVPEKDVWWIGEHAFGTGTSIIDGLRWQSKENLFYVNSGDGSSLFIKFNTKPTQSGTYKLIKLEVNSDDELEGDLEEDECSILVSKISMDNPDDIIFFSYNQDFHHHAQVSVNEKGKASIKINSAVISNINDTRQEAVFSVDISEK